MAGTRRRFLKVLGVATGGVTLAGALAYRHARSRASEYYRRWVELPQEGDVGPIGDAELATLVAATQTLLVDGIELTRYEDFFRWHAENARGYRQLYARFTAAVDAEARALGASSFVKADPDTKKQILDKLAGVRRTINSDDKVGGLMLAVFDREWLLYERYVAREILTLFGRTDAWVLSGYGPPPGVPRGLFAYRQPPEAR
jgi:hypothetical protein